MHSKTVFLFLAVMLLFSLGCASQEKEKEVPAPDTVTTSTLQTETTTPETEDLERKVAEQEALQKKLEEEALRSTPIKEPVETTTTTEETTTTSTTSTTLKDPVRRLEVYHFYGNAQCSSCIFIGECAEETVKKHFQEDVSSGRLVFAHVNYQQANNSALASRYGITGSSLWFGTYNSQGFTKTQDINVWYKTDNMDNCINYLKEAISGALKKVEE